MHHHIRLELTIRLKTPWRIGDSARGFWDHRLIKRDARNRPYIPASVLKGVIRHNCEKLARTLKFPDPSDPLEKCLGNIPASDPKITSPVDAIFGNTIEDGGLYFRDAGLSENAANAFVTKGFSLGRSRIDRIGSTLESTHNSEFIRPMVFETTIDGYHQNLIYFVEEDPPFAYCLLIAGVLLVNRIGAGKSAGGGWLDGNISISSMTYNDRPIPVQMAFTYLESSDYWQVRRML